MRFSLAPLRRWSTGLSLALLLGSGLGAAPLVITPAAHQPATGHANPLRGFHRWHDSTPDKQIVLDETPIDEYVRYRWKTLEPNLGDYSGIDTVLEPRIAAAAARGARFAFRVQGMVGYGDTQSYLPYDARPPGPGFVPLHQRGVTAPTKADGSDITFIPDWRDEGVLQAMEGLFAVLSQRYANDPRVAWVDIGWYGQFGEWVVRTPPPGVSYPRLDPNVEADRAIMRRIVDAQANAFPGQQLVVLVPYAAKPAIEYAFSLPRARPVGVRSDCFGRAGFFNQWTDRPAEWPMIRDRWLVAPVVGESCGKTDNTPAAAQIMLDQAELLHLSSFGNGNFYGLNLDPDGQPLLRELARRIGFQLRPQEILTQDRVVAGRALPLATRWINEGLARLYERFEARFLLRRVAGGAEFNVVSAIDLGTILPGPATAPWSDSLWVPEGAPPGDYELLLQATEHSPTNRPPLKFSIGGRDAEGRYLLAVVAVVAPTVPGAPTIAGIEAASRILVVSFIAPEDDGGKEILEYAVRCAPGGGPEIGLSATASPAVVDGLVNGTSYFCTVAARNASGWGPTSEPWGPVAPGPGYLAQRAYVAPQAGHDANVLQNCPATAPCRRIGVALRTVMAHGEVVLVETADYDAVTLTDSISLRAIPGIVANLPATAEGAVRIEGVGARVFLEGLSISGQGSGTGIVLNQGDRLDLRRMVVGMVERGVAVAAPARVSVGETLVRDVDVGFQIAKGARALVENTTIFGALDAGVLVQAESGQSTRVNLRRVLIGRSGNGVRANAMGGGALASVAIENARIDGGSAVGVKGETSAGGAAALMLRNSRISGFAIGVVQGDAGVSVFSAGGNVLSHNGSNVQGSLLDLPRM